MKKLMWLSFLLCFSAFSEEKCDKNKSECLIAITHMDGSPQTLNNFYISSLEQLSGGYAAIILRNNGPQDESGLFLIDKNKKHYLTLDYLPSHRGHDYFYQITSYGKNYVVIKGEGGYGYSVDGEVKYEIDFESENVNKFKLELVRVNGIYNDDEYLYLELYGKGLRQKVIQFHAGDKNLSFSFVELKNKKNKFKKIKSYAKTETTNIKYENSSINIDKDRIDNTILPQPSIAKYEKYRGFDSTLGALKLGYVGFENEIGTYLVKNNKIIFGISFYDGEGSTGIGGIGFYDIRKRTYDIHYIKNIANKSIGEMFYYEDELWCTLYQGGEGAKYHFGVLKYNINNKKHQVYDIPGKVDVVVPWKDFVFVNTSKGFYQINDGVKKGFFEINSAGDYKLMF